jgi:hypothetical protein
MKEAKRLCGPMLLGVLLMSALIGVASARPNARPEEQEWRLLTVPHSACIPKTDNMPGWTNSYTHLWCYGPGMCEFYCAVNFPAAGEQAVGAVNVKRVTMYAYDSSGTDGAAFTLRMTYPPTGGDVIMAVGGTVDSPADPQIVMDTTIENNPIYRSQAPHVVLLFSSTNLKVYGFYIHYTW